MSSFATKHNDYLDPDRHDLPVFEEPPVKYIDSLCTVDPEVLEKEIRSAMDYIEAHPEKFACKWEDLFSFCPEGDMEYEAEEAFEWVYVKDISYESGWTKEAYAFNLYRKDGVERVELMVIDADGNWDLCDEFTKEDKWFTGEMAIQSAYYTLLQNLLYSVYVAKTGLDPLDNTIGRKSPKEIHLRNLASDVLQMCLDVRKF
jgi:hypothetical protein